MFKHLRIVLYIKSIGTAYDSGRAAIYDLWYYLQLNDEGKWPLHALCVVVIMLRGDFCDFTASSIDKIRALWN